MRYLLDTNAVIAVLNDPSGPVARRVRSQSPRNVAVSSVVLHELYYGAYKSAAVERNLRVVDSLRFDVLPFDLEDARQAGRVRATLRGHGTPIGAYDVLIAGQACARRLTLITRNVREFRRVSALRVENWARLRLRF